MNPKLIILVGLPALGKSTFRKTFLRKNSSFVVISSDDYIESKAKEQKKRYSDVFQQEINNANNHVKNLFLSSLENKENIILDRTNLTRNSRKYWIQQATKHNYEIKAIVFELPENPTQVGIWADRLTSRKGKKIPAMVMQNMIASYETPELNEGFHQIEKYNTF